MKKAPLVSHRAVTLPLDEELYYSELQKYIETSKLRTAKVDKNSKDVDHRSRGV